MEPRYKGASVYQRHNRYILQRVEIFNPVKNNIFIGYVIYSF